MREVPYKVAVAEIIQAPQYQAVLHKVASLAPVVPTFNYAGESNIEEIKFKLAQREMLELVLTVLKGKAE